MKDIIHFAHGNGFPSPCYRQLLNGLKPHFDVHYIDRIGHNPLFPVKNNWQHLVDEVIFSIKSQSSQPVIGVGHSLGGVLSVLAAIQEPDIFKTVILLDSPLIGRFKSGVIWLSKCIGMIDYLTPAFRTRGRRQHWHSRGEVFSYLKKRKLFKHFTENCLNDYIDFGLKQDATGFSLRFDPETEYQIYRTLPHILYRYEKKLLVPTSLIYGDKSTVINATDLYTMKKYYDINCVKTEGTHMFPMEHPDVITQLIFNLVSEKIC